MAEPTIDPIATLRQLTPEELQARVAALRQEIWQDRGKMQAGALQQSHRIRQYRRQIARVMTIVKERDGHRS